MADHHQKNQSLRRQKKFQTLSDIATQALSDVDRLQERLSSVYGGLSSVSDFLSHLTLQKEFDAAVAELERDGGKRQPDILERMASGEVQVGEPVLLFRNQ